MKKAQSRQDITIREAFEQFQLHNQVNNLAKDTIRYYAQKSEYFFAFIGDIDVSVTSITPEVIESYILDMKKQGNLSDATINNRLRMVRAFLYYCMEREQLPRYSIKLVRASTNQKEPYTQEELKRLLKRPNTDTCSFAEYRNWVMVNFLLATGCRASTLIELQIKDIDLPAGMVFFRHTYAKLYIQAGGDPFRLQKLLGHSDLTMTRHYVALYADDLKANYDRLNPLEQFKRQTQDGDRHKMKK